MRGQQVRDWLIAILSTYKKAGHDKVPYPELYALGVKNGLSYRQIYNAKTALGIKTIKTGIGPEQKVYWSTEGKQNERD